MIDFWKNILIKLKEGQNVALMCVLESIGSSPGRQGFKMFVTEKGEMSGSIGGGFMEHKLVELSKSLLQKRKHKTFKKKQIHQSNISDNKSGMICSGEQTVAFYFLSKNEIDLIENIIKSKSIEFNEDGILCYSDSQNLHLEIKDNKWKYIENLSVKNTVYIVGGGHVGLALSKTMSDLNFEVVVLDDRYGLNTMAQNEYASRTEVVDYNEIERHIPEGDCSYVVLVSFGFRTDEICMKRLLGRNYKYFGVMGSKAKMEKLIDNLLNESFSQSDIDKVYTPIGLPISSKTPEEIAISITAEIIKIKNS